MTRRAFAVAFALVASLSLATASDAQSAEYRGRIVASETAVLSTQLNGVIAELLFTGGEAVVKGQPLIRLDPFDAENARATAEAHRDAAAARLTGAEREAGRARALSDRGVASEARRGQTETARAAAAAELAAAQAALRRAEVDVARTIIRAPIGGRISRPMVAVGAFVEAEAGPPLAEIVALDPVMVAYEVPYAARLARLRETGAATVEELLAMITIEIVMPGGAPYGTTARPGFAGAQVDPDTDAVTVWAEIANPDALLRPGMQVDVLSHTGEPQR